MCDWGVVLWVGCGAGLWVRLWGMAAGTLKVAVVDMMMATMMAKMPRAEAKISMTKIFTKRAPFCASASAHPLPQIPTHTLPRAGRVRVEVSGD